MVGGWRAAQLRVAAAAAGLGLAVVVGGAVAAADPGSGDRGPSAGAASPTSSAATSPANSTAMGASSAAAPPAPTRFASGSSSPRRNTATSQGSDGGIPTSITIGTTPSRPTGLSDPASIAATLSPTDATKPADATRPASAPPTTTTGIPTGRVTTATWPSPAMSPPYEAAASPSVDTTPTVTTTAAGPRRTPLTPPSTGTTAPESAASPAKPTPRASAAGSDVPPTKPVPALGVGSLSRIADLGAGGTDAPSAAAPIAAPAPEVARVPVLATSTSTDVPAAAEAASPTAPPSAVHLAAVSGSPTHPLPSPINVIGTAIFTLLSGISRLFDPVPVVPPGSTVTIGRSTLDIGCGCGQKADALWVFPNKQQPPDGLIYLQHGFFRSNNNMAAMAIQLADSTNSVVVVPTISSNPFATGGCWINGAPEQQAVAALFTGDRVALTASASAAAGHPVVLPRPFVLAGHSAGGNLATAVAGYTVDNGAVSDLRAVVLFDAVDSGGQMAAALAKLTGVNDRPVYQIASPCSLCNGFGSGTSALLDARPNRFVGVVVKHGTHIDAEGASTSVLAELVCGFPLPRNVAAVQTIAQGWILDAFTGSHTWPAPRGS